MKPNFKMHKHLPSTCLAFTYGKINVIHDIPLLCNTVSIEYHNVSKQNSAEEGPSRERQPFIVIRFGW